MNAPVKHTLLNNTFWLSAQRCLYWEEERALIVSDLHFGKTGHFRKNGIAVPHKIYLEDLQRLVDQLTHYKPEKMIIVGDLFHSESNNELDLFVKWRKDFAEIDFILVKGNHDILSAEWYQRAGIRVKEGCFTLGEFDFLHDCSDAELSAKKKNYTFSGHIHPGVMISGIGKQRLQFPCYYFSENSAILPAFSKFSGIALVKKKKNATIYAIVNQSLVNIK